ncbi:MAG: gamma-glutamyl-gamma-aminobutyrate hydrolase family protein [Pirellulales bacterium]
MHRKPIVGLNTDHRPARKERIPHSFIHAGYYDAIIAAGAVPMLIPPITDANDLSRVLDKLDGLVLTGGGDLDPKRLGVPSHPTVRPISERREDSDRLLCRLAVERRMPLLAIGLGMQTLNVVCGGSLYVHIPEDLPKALPHRDPLGGAHRHALEIEPGTRIDSVYGGGEIRVNSIHHQAVRKVADGFHVTATAPDGVAEAIEATDPGWFCLGVQWEPAHETASALDMQVFEEFVAACAPRELAVARSA